MNVKLRKQLSEKCQFIMKTCLFNFFFLFEYDKRINKGKALM